MLKGTVHACGDDANGFTWNWSREHQLPVALVPEEATRRTQVMIDANPFLYAWLEQPALPKPRRKERAQ